MSGLINKAAQQVEKATHPSGNTNTHTGGTGTHSTGTHHQAPGAYPDETYGNNTSAGYGNHPSSTNAGPHGSNMANKADPRFDSDLDGRQNVGHGHNTTGHHTGAPGGYNDSNATGPGYGNTSGPGYNNHPSSTNAGPHSSNMANKADPRFDSDLDGRQNVGGHGHHTGAPGGYGSTATGPGYGNDNMSHGHHTGAPGGYNDSTATGPAYGNTSGAGYNNHPSSTNAGPHSSNTANKVDPRFDSDLDGRQNVGHGGHGATGTGPVYNNTTGATHGTGTHGTHNTTGTTGVPDSHGAHNTTGGAHGTHGTTGHSGAGGPHSSKLGNKLDPNVDSKLPGPAPHTAGPHKSDVLNKLDPRVDSDLDGSKTVGGNKTYAGEKTTRGNTGY